MVQCDACNDWHHFKCVGVTDTVADVEWQCTKCVDCKTKLHLKADPIEVMRQAESLPKWWLNFRDWK